MYQLICISVLLLFFFLEFTLMTSCEISYSSVTTTADDVVEFTNLTRLTCKLKLDWNSISHQPGVKEVYALPYGWLHYPPISFTPVWVGHQVKFWLYNMVKRMRGSSLIHLFHSWLMTYRIPIQLQLTGKSR